MNTSLLLACAWFIAVNVTGMLPSKRHHWPQAYFFIAVGIPILGYLTYENGPLLGLIALAAGASVLRWPVIYLWRWIRRRGAAKG